jgi:hypothetical protein
MIALPVLTTRLSKFNHHRSSKIRQDMQFNTGNFSFEGTPVDQARCLLRKVLPLGNVGDTAVVLPTLLEDLIGKAVDISTASFADFLSEQGISEEDIGGAHTDPLSRTDGEDGPVKRASYFVIHDTRRSCRKSGSRSQR